MSAAAAAGGLVVFDCVVAVLVLCLGVVYEVVLDHHAVWNDHAVVLAVFVVAAVVVYNAGVVVDRTIVLVVAVDAVGVFVVVVPDADHTVDHVGYFVAV